MVFRAFLMLDSATTLILGQWLALKLKEIFGANDINDLPIFFNIAWYEQKAVIVLLALLHLGVKNIHIGPTLPAFVSEAYYKCWLTISDLQATLQWKKTFRNIFSDIRVPR